MYVAFEWSYGSASTCSTPAQAVPVYVAFVDVSITELLNQYLYHHVPGTDTYVCTGTRMIHMGNYVRRASRCIPGLVSLPSYITHTVPGTRQDIYINAYGVAGCYACRSFGL